MEGEGKKEAGQTRTRNSRNDAKKRKFERERKNNKNKNSVWMDACFTFTFPLLCDKMCWSRVVSGTRASAGEREGWGTGCACVCLSRGAQYRGNNIWKEKKK